MAKLRMAHASMHGARKPPGPKYQLPPKLPGPKSVSWVPPKSVKSNIVVQFDNLTLKSCNYPDQCAIFANRALKKKKISCTKVITPSAAFRHLFILQYKILVIKDVLFYARHL